MIQRIRTIKPIASKYGYYPEGTLLHIPRDLDEITALSWLKGGLVEEDKMIDGPPETKRARRKKCRTL